MADTGAPDNTRRDALADAAGADGRFIDAPATDGGETPPKTLRALTRLGGNWRFRASDTLTGAEAPGFNDSSWETVQIPHSWNRPKGVPRTNYDKSYSNAWYRHRFTSPQTATTARSYFVFDGVALIADVYLNGAHVGTHRGGFTRFVVDATSAMRPAGEENVLAVRVNNRIANCQDCLPGPGRMLWNYYGGIYRPAALLQMDSVGVDPTYYGSPGVLISQKDVSTESATVDVRVMLRNDLATSVTAGVKVFVVNNAGQVALSLSSEVPLQASARSETKVTGKISSPALWGPKAPNLYRVRTEVWTNGVLRDATEEQTGFRYFKLTPTEFSINGVPTPLRGINKHQENEEKGAALSDEELRSDWDLLEELGVNTVRLVHYPHRRLEYDEADKRGLILWAENGHTNTAVYSAHADELTREMVFQGMNHPSIVFWSVGNESPDLDALSLYASAVRQADPTRPVVYATGDNDTNTAGVDFIFRNLYPGWYGSNHTVFEALAAAAHYISETGAGGVITHHAPYDGLYWKVHVFEPEEYFQLVNEDILDVVFRRRVGEVPVFFLWQFRDSALWGYEPDGWVTKGLLTPSGFKKDVFYLYKAFSRPNVPTVHLVGKHYFLRSGEDAVKVYSNTSTVELKVNGISKGTVANGSYKQPKGQVIQNVFLWDGALKHGRNDVVVTDGAGHSDAAVIYYTNGSAQPPEASAPIDGLTSTNPASPAWWISAAPQSQWPFYAQFDGTANNTFIDLPPQLDGAGWIATRSQTQEATKTTISFRITASKADVYVMMNQADPVPAWLSGAGFTDTGQTGTWRNNDLTLVPYRLLVRHASSGDKIVAGGTLTDFVMLVKN